MGIGRLIALPKRKVCILVHLKVFSLIKCSGKNDLEISMFIATYTKKAVSLLGGGGLQRHATPEKMLQFEAF